MYKTTKGKVQVNFVTKLFSAPLTKLDRFFLENKIPGMPDVWGYPSGQAYGAQSDFNCKYKTRQNKPAGYKQSS
jgi:hypothetical protein